MLDERADHRDVLRWERHPRTDLVDELDPDLRVVARIPLADVVQQRADEQEVRPCDVAHVVACVDDGLQEVTVDGVACGTRCAAAGCARGATPGSIRLNRSYRSSASIVSTRCGPAPSRPTIAWRVRSVHGSPSSPATLDSVSSERRLIA